MDDTIHWLMLNGELPNIGSGRRRVIATIGWKWVTVRRMSRGNPRRVRRHIWDNLVAITAAHDARNHKEPAT